MSLYIEFEPHSWYKGFAIEKREFRGNVSGRKYWYYIAYTDNGNTCRVDEISSNTIKVLKQLITEYRGKKQ